MSTQVLLLEDELVEHLCPLHADVEVGDLSRLTDGQRRWCEIACDDIRFCEGAARLAQVALTHADPGDKRWALELRLEKSLAVAARVRENLRRMIAGEPEPERSDIDLWQG